MYKSNRYITLLIITALSPSYIQTSCTQQCDTTCSQSKNLFLPRAFSSYSSRTLIQEKSVLQVESDRSEWNGTLSVDVEYMSNFGQKCGTCKNIGALPFWSGTNTLTIGTNDGKAQLDAYQLGMGNIAVDSNGIGGIIELNPSIQQVGADVLLYFTQYKNQRGYYFKIDAPLGAMMITPRLTELVKAKKNNNLTTSQVTNDPNSSTIEYAFDTYPAPLNRPETVTQAFTGDLPIEMLIGYHPVDISLLKGRISSCCKQTTIRLSDLSATVGYNVYATDNSIVGIGLKATCPTGNVPTANYMLEPIFGRAGAWGIGGEIMAHHKVWQDNKQSRYVDLWLQAELLHLIPGRTPNWRSFDLKANGPGSKYLLIQHYSTQYAIDGSFNNIQDITAGSLQPAINLTTLPVISKIAAEGSVALMADFHYNDWNFGLGAEFWGRTHECLAINDCSPEVVMTTSRINQYAVLGRQLSAYQINGIQNALQTFYCEPAAKINQSQDPATLIGSVATTLTAPTSLPAGIKDARISTNRIPSDLNEALDIDGAAAAKAYTGKIFSQIGYTFKEHRCTPTISIVGGAEYTNNTNNAVQMWSIAIQGALNF